MKIVRVLILEDDAFQRRFLQLYLEGAGFIVEYVENGFEGLKKLKESKPFDLIMSDLKMPIMNGLEFLKEVKKNNQFNKIPIVFLSSIDDDKIKQYAVNIGASCFMEKPFSNEKISIVLKALEEAH